MNRRNFLNISSITALALASSACTSGSVKPQNETEETILNKKLQAQKTKTRVVIVGGGFGGLNTASAIKQNDPKDEIEVIVLEKNPTYFVCPMSNTLLSGDKMFKRENFVFDYTNVQLEYNYDVIQTEVLDINRKKRNLLTTQGLIEYDYLVLAPGMVYDYKVEFPHWSDKKIKRAQLEAPGGLISDSGVEHSILLAQLEKFKQNGGEGEIVIVPPRIKLIKGLDKEVPHKSLHRCKPAAYERACMIGDWIKRNGFEGKATISILDSSPRPQAKAAAFEEVFKDQYTGIINYVGGFDLMDVDFDKKEITYRGINDDADYIKATRSYDLLNLIPIQNASPLIAMAGLKTNSWGGAILKPKKMYSVTDDRVFVVGDSAVFKKGVFVDNKKKKGGVPAAAQTAYSLGKESGKIIAQRILNAKDIDLVHFSASCFSMVTTVPHKKGISITKDFSYDKDGTMLIKEKVPKVNGKYYNETGGEGLLGWFDGVTSDTFAKF